MFCTRFDCPLKDIFWTNNIFIHTHTRVGCWRSFCILRLYSKSTNCNMSSTHSFLSACTHTEGEFTLTQILVSSRPLSKFGKQMWKQERGETLGEGEQYERWTNRLAARKGIVLLAPFSHYTTLSPSVCVCILNQIMLTSFSRLSLTFQGPAISGAALAAERRGGLGGWCRGAKEDEIVTFW